MPTIVHFDISANEPERAKKFYEILFDWKINPIPGIASYYEIETIGLDGARGTGGGITLRENPQQNQITNFIGVASIDETIVQMGKLGGKVTRPKQAVPGYGYLALCIDTEGNTFGLFQEDKDAH